MSRDRMLDLRNRLMLDGWEVTRQSDDGLKDDSSIKNLVRPAYDSITWHIVHPEKCVELDLVFALVGLMGERTSDLRDIFRCDAKGQGLRLFFSKINAETWRSGSADFIAKLGQIGSAGSSDLDT